MTSSTRGLPVADAISSTARAPRSGLRASSRTRASSRAKPSAAARPRPLVPPVTSTVRPLSEGMRSSQARARIAYPRLV